MNVTLKLESALQLASHGFRVFPLTANSKIPMKGFTNFSERATTDERQIEKWFSGTDFNIGISTEDLLAVDIDVKNGAQGLETIAKLNNEGKILTPTTQQITPTGGIHLIYKTPYAVRNSASKIGPGVDIRGKGGFLVGAGSVIDGKFYKIEYRPTPEAPRWLFESCSEARTEAPQAHIKLEGINQDQANTRGLSYLNSIPKVLSGNRNAEGFRVAARLKDFGVDKNDTFLLMMEEWKCEPPLELTELKAVVTSAYKYGKEPQGAAAPETQFEPVTTASTEIDTGENPVQILNKEYAFITMGSTHRILRETTDERGDLKVQYLSEDTFHKKLLSRNFQTGDGRIIKLSKHWIASHERREYERAVYAPGLKIEDRFYNLWRGFSVKPLEPTEAVTEDMLTATSMFEEHLLKNVCENNKEYAHWVMAWFAHIIQKPHTITASALVLKGKKGVGKNVLLDCVGALFNPHYMVTADKRFLLGNFNAHMEHTSLLVLDEATWGGAKEEDSKLKALITGKELEIERKGVDSYKARSYINVAILGNEDWIVPATEGERRYAVFNVGEGRKKDTVWFGKLIKAMENGGSRYLLTKLLEYDISKVDFRNPPETEALGEQKLQGLNPLEAYWYDALRSGYIEGLNFLEDKKWETKIDVADFYPSAKRSIESIRGKSSYLTTSKFLKLMKDVLPVGSKLTFNICIIPSLDECREDWDKRIGYKTEW